jgi:hypothetical protein
MFGLTIAVLSVLIYSALAVNQPVLRIAPLGSNYFNIVITNGVNTNYTLWWTPALASETYPWTVLGTNAVGETNFIVNGGEWPVGFFRAMIGVDQDGDGAQEWEDAQPLNPNVGILSVTIDSPLQGEVIQ